MRQALIALDQLFNTVFFWWCGKAWADETISARSWRQRHKQPFKTLQPVIDRLSFDQNHCINSYLSEKRRSQLPPEYRQ